MPGGEKRAYIQMWAPLSSQAGGREWPWAEPRHRREVGGDMDGGEGCFLGVSSELHG